MDRLPRGLVSFQRRRCAPPGVTLFSGNDMRNDLCMTGFFMLVVLPLDNSPRAPSFSIHTGDELPLVAGRGYCRTFIGGV